RDDGIGGWSEANFVTAMWKGTSPDGSHYYPVFPYTSYQRMRLEDVRDLFAYLKTLPAGPRKARRPRPPPPFKIRPMPPGLEIPFSRRRAVQARHIQVGAVESRRLSCQWPGTLRGVPQPAQSPRRHHRQSALCRRA